MGFLEAVKSVFSNYVTFSGRARRSEYWWFFLFNLIASILLGLIPIVGAIYSLAALLPSLAVTVRRLHDTEHSGWYIFLPVLGGIIVAIGMGLESQPVIIAGGIVALGLYILMLVWMVSDGTRGPNRFGDDPKSPTSSAVAAF